MPKAHLIMDGNKITVEGTQEEVITLIKKFKAEFDLTGKISRRTCVKSKTRKIKATPTNLVVGLIDGGFFKKSKDIAAIRYALEEQGHKLPITKLSPVLIRLVRAKQLKRTKDKKRWLYYNN